MLCGLLREWFDAANLVFLDVRNPSQHYGIQFSWMQPDSSTEVMAYSKVLSAIDQNLRRPAIVEAVRTGEGDFCSQVKRSLDDCTEILVLLEEILAKLGGTSNNPFAKVAEHVKFGVVYENIATLRRQIDTYNSTMQLALPMCLLSQNMNKEALNETLTSKINCILDETRVITKPARTMSSRGELAATRFSNLNGSSSI